MRRLSTITVMLFPDLADGDPELSIEAQDVEAM